MSISEVPNTHGQSEGEWRWRSTIGTPPSVLYAYSIDAPYLAGIR